MDRIQCEILPDGKLSVKTDAISKKNHLNADELMEMLEDYVGEVESREQLKHSHQHLHETHHLHQH